MHATPERQAGATHHFSELVTPQIQALQLREFMHASADTHTQSITNIINHGFSTFQLVYKHI